MSSHRFQTPLIHFRFLLPPHKWGGVGVGPYASTTSPMTPLRLRRGGKTRLNNLIKFVQTNSPNRLYPDVPDAGARQTLPWSRARLALTESRVGQPALLELLHHPSRQVSPGADPRRLPYPALAD